MLRCSKRLKDLTTINCVTSRLHFVQEEKEEEFHRNQAKKRSEIRIKEGREKAIDILAKNVHLYAFPLLCQKYKRHYHYHNTTTFTITMTTTPVITVTSPIPLRG
jgi:hypothetical protein